MRYTISDCARDDLSAIVPQLRADDRAEIRALGLPPRRVLRDLWLDSSVSRAARIDGKLAAIWGAQGGPLDSDVNAWLFTTKIIEGMPLAFFREARLEMRELLDRHRTVTTGVLSSYYRSLRFWTMIGFSHTGTYTINGTEFVRLTMGHD